MRAGEGECEKGCCLRLRGLLSLALLTGVKNSATTGAAGAAPPTPTLPSLEDLAETKEA